MTQLFLLVIPQGSNRISDTASVVNKDGRWVYFFGPHPIFEHNEGDNRMFKVVTSQLIHHGACRHRDIMATFGVSKRSVNRALKKLPRRRMFRFPHACSSRFFRRASLPCRPRLYMSRPQGPLSIYFLFPNGKVRCFPRRCR